MELCCQQNAAPSVPDPCSLERLTIPHDALPYPHGRHFTDSTFLCKPSAEKDIAVTFLSLHAFRFLEILNFRVHPNVSFRSSSVLAQTSVSPPSTRTLLTSSMPTSSSTCIRRPRPSVASHLRDPDEPVLISTNFPKKARPAQPPISLRMTLTSPYSSTPPTTSSRATTLTSSTFSSASPPPLVGFLVKLNGEQVPFLIPRPSMPFRLPEAKP